MAEDSALAARVESLDVDVEDGAHDDVEAAGELSTTAAGEGGETGERSGRSGGEQTGPRRRKSGKKNFDEIRRFTDLAGVARQGDIFETEKFVMCGDGGIAVPGVTLSKERPERGESRVVGDSRGIGGELARSMSADLDLWVTGENRGHVG